MVEVPAALQSFMATRDNRLSKSLGYPPSEITESFRRLLEYGSVRVGGRASCGSGSHPSWKVFQAWNEVVRKARQLGYAIEETDLKQKNGWATNNGGFWEEREYRLNPNP
jgi:Asp-tRNA(Asn)/Glu-tRNA(Gln) amidotransferase A subunit family amidase